MTMNDEFRLIRVSVNGGASLVYETFSEQGRAQQYGKSMYRLSSTGNVFLFKGRELVGLVDSSGRLEPVSGPITFVKDHSRDERGRYLRHDIVELLEGG